MFTPASLGPILLYVACALGAVGVVLAMPRKNVAAYVIGAAVGAVALAVAMVGLGLATRSAGGVGAGELPGPLFYIFAAVALGSSLRVITHPRPIYAALYFIMTILSSAGLYILLAAEFMAFALIIIYAGAILITYMFVIMLASEGPTESAAEGATEYDRVSREPVVATIAGFVLLAALTTMLMGGPGPGSGGAGGGGVRTLAAQNSIGGERIAFMTERFEQVLREAGKLAEGEKLAAASIGEEGVVNFKAGIIKITAADGKERVLPKDQWPVGLAPSNSEALGFELVDANPGAIEIAGVILLMAMLGAVILARKKVEMDDAAKAAAAARARSDDDGGLGADGPYAPPAVGGNQ